MRAYRQHKSEGGKSKFGISINMSMAERARGDQRIRCSAANAARLSTELASFLDMSIERLCLARPCGDANAGGWGVIRSAVDRVYGSFVIFCPISWSRRRFWNSGRPILVACSSRYRQQVRENTSSEAVGIGLKTATSYIETQRHDMFCYLLLPSRHCELSDLGFTHAEEPCNHRR